MAKKRKNAGVASSSDRQTTNGTPTSSGLNSLSTGTQTPTVTTTATTTASRRTAYHTSLRPSSYIPSVSLQVIAAAYCLFALPGRQGREFELSTLLQSLERNPVQSLSKVLPGLLVSQLYFGGQMKRWWDAAEAQKKGTRQQKSESEGDGDGDDAAIAAAATGREERTRKKTVKDASESLDRKLGPLLETCSVTVVATLVFFVMIMLMGGMLAKKHTETLQLSAFLALLAITPAAYAITSPFAKTKRQAFTRYTWLRLFIGVETQSDVEVAIIAPAFGAILGCVLSAPALALDWEEPWQTWPLPCIVGTYLGWVLGHLFALGFCALLWLGRGRGSSGSGVTTSFGEVAADEQTEKSL